MDCGGEEKARQNGHGGDSGDPAEWKKVAELRAVVETQDPAVKEWRRMNRRRDQGYGRTPFTLPLGWKRLRVGVVMFARPSSPRNGIVRGEGGFGCVLIITGTRLNQKNPRDRPPSPPPICHFYKWIDFVQEDRYKREVEEEEDRQWDIRWKKGCEQTERNRKERKRLEEVRLAKLREAERVEKRKRASIAEAEDWAEKRARKKEMEEARRAQGAEEAEGARKEGETEEEARNRKGKGKGKIA